MKTPSAIEMDNEGHTVVLHWPGDAVQHIAHQTLRAACPCAQCRRLRIGGDSRPSACNVAVTDIRPMGYGIQLVFSDGHERGIFPWQYLECLPDTRTMAAACRQDVRYP
ncbi:MAG TPA: gamma-butyrobetaine hydroxylase-like domain-containing protein [Paraburkholderia sp.]